MTIDYEMITHHQFSKGTSLSKAIKSMDEHKWTEFYTLVIDIVGQAQGIIPRCQQLWDDLGESKPAECTFITVLRNGFSNYKVNMLDFFDFR